MIYLKPETFIAYTLPISFNTILASFSKLARPWITFAPISSALCPARINRSRLARVYRGVIYLRPSKKKGEKKKKNKEKVSVLFNQAPVKTSAKSLPALHRSIQGTYSGLVIIEGVN